MLKFLTAGESHGKCLTAILEGFPSGIEVSSGYINTELERRQGGYGRGGRMKIEKDRADITAGVRHGKTLGSPIAMLIENKDWVNWLDIMSPDEAGEGAVVTRPRPGHADLAGGLKYDHKDLRNILERSSARETAARAAVGAVSKRLLHSFGINVYSWVSGIGEVFWDGSGRYSGFDEIFAEAEGSDVRCPDKKATEKMKKAIDTARKNGDSIGGVFEVVVTGVPPGLGSHVQWDRKLDGRLAQALMSIQAIKGVEAGIGFAAGSMPGSKAHDEIFYTSAKVSNANGFWPRHPRFYRKTNNAGGIEGGMSNGEPIVLRAVMKPIPTLYKPLRSVDIITKKPFAASVERSDTCAVPAAAIVAEAAVAFTLADVFLEKTGGDSAVEIDRNYKGYLKQLAGY
jgi:chorismate synthase